MSPDLHALFALMRYEPDIDGLFDFHLFELYSQVRNIDNSLYMWDASSRDETRRAHT
jgi:hypothetical protein